jgi:predicted O-methyltransferase YrrM
MKRAYVSLVRLFAAVARAVGLLRCLERNRQSRVCLYLRSLFSIYDARDLAKLDLPWWTFGAIDYIDAILRERGGRMIAFEYGSGASTLWLARRCQMVHSVEHDPGWAAQIRLLCEQHGNVTIAEVPTTPASASTRCRSERAGWTTRSFDRYVESIRAYPFDFDLIVIDGRCRAECLSEAKRKLKDGGLIVFDNSNRRRYHDAITDARLEAKIFRGLVPGLPFRGETTVLRAASASANSHRKSRGVTQ